MSSIYGIQNLGNTCYINVIIQMILNSESLNNLLITKKEILNDKDLLYSYVCILKRLEDIRKQENLELSLENDTVYIRKLRLTSFIDKFRNIFSQVSFNQQDCLEGLDFILTNFHQTLSKYEKYDDYKLIFDNLRYNTEIQELSIIQYKNDILKDHSLLFNIFYSYYLTIIKCNKCENKSNKIEQYKEISLHVSTNPSNNNIEKLLDNYFSDEKLDDYKCDKCNEKDAHKKISLLNIPKYLIIQLKRFQFNSKNMNFSKILEQVNYPLFLDMDKYCLNNNINTNINNKNIYELTNVIYHLGIQMGSGHYTSHHKVKNNWFYADDDNIEKIDETELFNKRNKILSYVLIYENKLFD